MKDQGSMLKQIAYTLFMFAMILAILLPSILIYHKGFESILALDLGGWGDFLAGAFGPASLLVLAAGFILQQEELQIQRRELESTRMTLDDQKAQMERSANEAAVQTSILYQQSVVARWNICRGQLHGLLFLIDQNMSRQYGQIDKNIQIEAFCSIFFVRINGLSGDLLEFLAQVLYTDKYAKQGHDHIKPEILDALDFSKKYIKLIDNFLDDIRDISVDFSMAVKNSSEYNIREALNYFVEKIEMEKTRHQG